MAEATAASPEQQEQEPAPAPSLTAEQVADIVRSAIDQRVPGIMSTYDKRLNSFQEELRRATMSEREIEEENERAESAELERLRRENALLLAGADFPEAVKVFNELNGKASGKEQLEYLDALIKRASTGNAAPVEPAAEEEEASAAPVDSNRRGDVTQENLSAAEADGILSAFKEWPGADFFRR